jgi:hypothetical protein
VLLTTLRRLPGWLVVLGLGVVSVVCTLAELDLGSAEKIPRLAFFFAIGVHGAGALRLLAERTGWVTGGLTALTALATVAAGTVVEGDLGRAVLFLLRGTAFLLLGIVVVVVAIRWRPVARFATSLGRQTLPVYVLHVPLVLLLVAFTSLALRGPLDRLLSHTGVALAYPLVLTAAIVLISLLVHRLLVRLRLGALFAMPEAVTRWVTAPYRRRERPAAPGYLRTGDSSPMPGGDEASGSGSSRTVGSSRSAV